MLRLQDDKVIHTERLSLEPLRVAHASLLFGILQNERIYNYIPEHPPVTLPELETRYKALEKRISPSKKELWLNWAAKIRTSSQYIGTMQATVYENMTANLAYVLSPDFWKMGFAFEASTAVLTFLFNDYQIEKVTASVDIDNLPSKRLLQRLGFKQYASDPFSRDEFYELSRNPTM